MNDCADSCITLSGICDIIFLVVFQNFMQRKEMHKGYLSFSFAVIAMETLKVRGTAGRRWKGRDKGGDTEQEREKESMR